MLVIGDSISNTTAILRHLALPTSAQSAKWYHHINLKFQRKATRRRAVRSAFLIANLALLTLIVSVVVHNPQTSGKASAALLSNDKTTSAVANPLDQLSSASIALTIAKLNNLPEATAINNQADSQASELTMAPTYDSVVSKPQVVVTALKSRADIKSYQAVGGDTVTAIASKFGVTSDSVRWSNNLTGDAVAVGSNLVIPPVNGIVYTVANTDTADTIAAKYKASKDQIIAYNDAEIKGLKVGERIIIPNGTVTPTPVTARAIAASSTTFPWGGVATYGSNGYDFGYCTWYVASKISVPSNWGNANTWDNLAPLSGWAVSSAPRVGAIAQTDGNHYIGTYHVAIVEAVSADGSQIKYSDMNGIRGWGNVGFSDWVSSAYFEHYIYR